MIFCDVILLLVVPELGAARYSFYICANKNIVLYMVMYGVLSVKNVAEACFSMNIHIYKYVMCTFVGNVTHIFVRVMCSVHLATCSVEWFSYTHWTTLPLAYRISQ